jgi:hypothetical protein
MSYLLSIVYIYYLDSCTYFYAATLDQSMSEFHMQYYIQYNTHSLHAAEILTG